MLVAVCDGDLVGFAVIGQLLIRLAGRCFIVALGLDSRLARPVSRVSASFGTVLTWRY